MPIDVRNITCAQQIDLVDMDGERDLGCRITKKRCVLLSDYDCDLVSAVYLELADAERPVCDA